MKNGKPQEIINLNLNRLQNRGSNQPTGIDFQKYIHFLMEKRRWLIIITAAVGVLWILFYSLFKDRLVKYETVATIRFDNLDKASAIREFDVTGIEGKLAILTTKNFLGRVSDSLDFQIAFEKEALSNKTFVRDSFIPSDDPPYGAYQIEYSGNQFSLLYTSPDKSVEDKTVQSGVVREGSPIQLRYRGFYLDLESSILESYPDLRFHLIPRVLAANAIAKNFVFYLRSQSILDITYTHRDPEFSAKVCNTIARTFVQQLLEYKRNQTSSVLTSLEEQLRVARKDLEGSERELQTFREANPTITLRDESKRVVDELTTYESRYQDLKTVETGLDNLIAKGGSAASKEERLYAYQEIIDYLKFHKQPGMEGIQLQYQDLLEEREKYKRTNYLPNSPEMRKVDQSLAELQGLVDQRVTDYKSGIANFSERNRREIYSIRSDLQRLPQNELKLAELQRDREIKEKILTSVQLRFNEARVSDAAIIPDAYIIDEAYPPLVTGGLSTDLKYWLIGPVLGFMLGVALFLGLAFFDNTVKGTSETEQKLGLPVWATVPTIVLDESALPANGSRQVDPKLITGDYSPDLASESFRRLRTKISLYMKEGGFKSFLITSISAGEGKSLTSSNLSVTFAQQRMKTLLVDMDIRRGVQHNTFVLKKRPGVTDILMSKETITQDFIDRHVQATHIPNLSVIPCGRPVPNPLELVSSDRMGTFIRTVEEHFDAVVFDSAPLTVGPENFILGTIIPEIFLVTSYGSTAIRQVRNITNELEDMGLKIRSVIINHSAEQTREAGYYTYYRY